MNDSRKAANGTTVECAIFQNQLASLIGAGEDLQEHAHLKSCAICRALVSDLQAIADMAKLLLPMHDPGPAVWQKIENAIKKEPPNAK